MAESIDIPLPHGWHLTIFNPWLTLAVAVAICAAILWVARRIQAG